MKYFRNSSVQIDICLHLSILICSLIIGYFCHAMIPVFIISALYIILHFAITFRRYNTIENFSRMLDRILHHEEVLHPGDYHEGELGVLEDQIGKLTLRLRHQTEMLQADKKYLADSMADISHQLRTPLTSMNLLLTLLQNPRLSPSEQTDYRMRLSSLLQRIDWLITTLLRISQLDAGVISMQKAPLLVKDLIQRACEPFAVSMDIHNQKLLLDIQENASYNGDLFWSTEAISNILKNCTEHIGDEGTISIQATQNPIYTQIKIIDDGPGFDAADLPHIFDRFYKGKTNAEQSYGIGLALARQILQQQNGQIQASNAPQGGACFTIRIYHK